MSQETKRAATVDAATAQSTTDKQGKASLRHKDSTTKARFVCRGQLTFLFDTSLPRPQDLARFKNQRATIINYLLDGKPLTQDTSRYLFGVMRLASRVSELRATGWNISRRMIVTGENSARVAEYWLNRENSRGETTP